MIKQTKEKDIKGDIRLEFFSYGKDDGIIDFCSHINEGLMHFSEEDKYELLSELVDIMYKISYENDNFKININEEQRFTINKNEEQRFTINIFSNEAVQELNKCAIPWITKIKLLQN